jgi:hypothetical protein
MEDLLEDLSALIFGVEVVGGADVFPTGAGSLRSAISRHALRCLRSRARNDVANRTSTSP